jgi:hypothetical protein
MRTSFHKKKWHAASAHIWCGSQAGMAAKPHGLCASGRCHFKFVKLFFCGLVVARFVGEGTHFDRCLGR